MLLSDFIAARAEYRKRSVLAVGVALLLTGIYSVLLLSHIEGVTAFVAHHFAPSVAGFVQGLLIFPLILITLLTIWAFDRESSRDRRLRCPHRGKRLDAMSALVIATKSCFHCGKNVLSEEV